jgi:putative transposase
MPDDVARYPRYRFPPAITSHTVWLYYRFTLSFRDVEDLLAQRGEVMVRGGTGAAQS